MATNPQTFRQLIDRVAVHGMPVDRKRTIRELALRCGISRAHLYNALTGRSRLKSDMIDGLAKKLIRIAPWVTIQMVRDAVGTTFRRTQAKLVRELAL